MAGVEEYRVRDVREAVELAQQFKASGRYDWFRGQVRAWRPHSSAYRSWRRDGSEGLANVEWRQQQFLDWAANAEGLEALAADEDSLYAVMQHYGIPTYYIDFTTDPSIAGFFAADTTRQQSDALSCIYCLNTADLLEYWHIMRGFLQEGRRGLELRPVTLGVPNLWRLEAQKGVFLYANYDWDSDYPPDRILFPYTGYPESPRREWIYPERKSALEILLDQYFDRERTLRGRQVIDGLVARLESRGDRVLRRTLGSRDDLCRPEAVRGDSVEIHPSWDQARLAMWLSMPTETLVDTAGPDITISLAPGCTHRDVGAVVREQVADQMQAQLRLRRSSAPFHVKGLPGYLLGGTKRLGSILDYVWDGMRRLPFSDEDIAEAMGHAAALFAWGFHLPLSAAAERMASDYFGDAEELEFSATDGSSSRGYAAKRDLLGAVRPDIREILSDEYQEAATNITDLLLAICSPARLFEFEAFARVFARQIIPSQVLRRDRVLFSPARLRSFGIV